MRTMRPVLLGALLLTAFHLATAGEPAKRDARTALAPFNELVGSWRGTGTPAGSRDEQLKGFWVETVAWEWQFKGKDVWMKLDVKNGKHLESGNLRYLPDKDLFELTAKTTDKKDVTFVGKLNERVLTLEREEGKEVQRLIFTLLHPERHLYRYEVKPAGKNLFARRYQVGATKEGVEFAKGDGRPECIVTGGLGTMAVSYQGQTYYVCCSGCRDEFNANPTKYINEAKAKKNKSK